MVCRLDTYISYSPPFVESNRGCSEFPVRLRPEHMLLVLVDTEQSSYWQGGGSGCKSMICWEKVVTTLGNIVTVCARSGWSLRQRFHRRQLDISKWWMATTSLVISTFVFGRYPTLKTCL